MFYYIISYMNIEKSVFKKYSPDFNKLLKYGFKKTGDKFVFEKIFKDNCFKAIFTVYKNEKYEGKVIDIESNDEFLPLRTENVQGGFVGEIKKLYEDILINIRDNCFSKNYFVLPQSNRITYLIKEKYGNSPEFLWEKYDGTGIFRNPDSNKWYAIIMDIDRLKIQKNRKGFIEVLGLKLTPEHVEKIVQKPNFYNGYHLNKKHWITIILDESVPDKKIMELLEESHNLTQKKK